jgi:hypothetical protein
MVELDSEGKLTRTEVATFLHEFASEIDDGMHTDDAMHTDTRGEGVTDRGDREFTDEEPLDHTDEESINRKRITVIVGGDSATVTVPERVDFDVDVESTSPMLSSGVHQGIEFDLSWEITDPDELDEDWIEVE